MKVSETKIRTIENVANEVFFNINDLIIELMLEAEKVETQNEKQYIKKLINRLVRLRNNAHDKH
jgi:hypothetical protein